MIKRTLYVHRKLINPESFISWFSNQGVLAIDPAKLHATIAYSKEKVYWEDLFFNNKIVRIKHGKRSIKTFDGGATVLTFESDLLSSRWSYFLENGCSWDYPEYNPHITIGYNLPINTKTLIPYKGELVFGPEIYEDIDEDWTQ